jgi:hypothetical protein
MARPTSTIAAYGFLVSCYFYWDTRMQGFYLMEIAPGNLMQVQQTPIVFRRCQQR